MTDIHDVKQLTVGFWAFHKFLEILLEIRYLLQIRISGNFRGNMHAPAETVSRIFQDTHVQSHFGGRCGVPPPQARKILPKTGPFLSKSTILCVSLGLPGSGAGADIEIFGLDPHQIFFGYVIWTVRKICECVCVVISGNISRNLL